MPSAAHHKLSHKIKYLAQTRILVFFYAQKNCLGGPMTKKMVSPPNSKKRRDQTQRPCASALFFVVVVIVGGDMGMTPLCQGQPILSFLGAMLLADFCARRPSLFSFGA
ncbi:hypothetical protein TW95_gp1530 [Pandoravirus inopinatum]|uniref:Uncharacterized protein n=1 Tax=Pandoravirus inopinatum TaxID=1605721 RepID=A0A0B5J3U3_9VIRU|nr:hypothetical protein TW95_gp1530 [Pandoravirus inopinatum]AJF98264.1 hypothetical protein [Pandoravirus inopinatum]